MSWSSPSVRCATSIAPTAIICTKRTCCRRGHLAGLPTNCSKSSFASTSPARRSMRSSSTGMAASRPCWAWISIGRWSSCSRNTRERSASENDFQTNGVLLDESWCEFFKENRFYVGLSIDGPKELHDRFRIGKGGSPTFDQVYRAARLLRRARSDLQPDDGHQSVNARHPAEVYRFLTEDLGCSRLQWLPCVEPKDFHTVAPGRWDTTRMPIHGDSRSPARPSRFGGHGLVGRSRRLGRVPLPDV